MGLSSERLEERSLLSVSALFVAGELSIALDSTDSVAVGENPTAPGTVLVLANGLPLSSVSGISASQVTKIFIEGGDDANTIDLTGVTASAFINPLLSIEVHAGNGDDTLLGSVDLADSLDGGHGDDSINGNGGNDTLLGNDGDDSISGGAGNDSIDAGDGQDTVDGNDGDDTILAGDGEDQIDGSAGNDSISGDDGVDTLRGGDGNDTLNGNAGTDSIDGQNGDDSIYGGNGDDTLLGGSGADVLDGQGGHDLEFAEAATGQAPVSTTFVSQTGFSTNFDSGVPTELSGTTTVAAVQGYAGIGTGANVFAGNLLHNNTGASVANPGSIPQTPTTLTLTALPTHNSIDINFLLAIINSFNGLNPSVNFANDFFNVRVDGNVVFRANFDNGATPSGIQGYNPPPGVALTPPPLVDLGFTPEPNRVDSAWNVGLDPLLDDIPHTASTLTIDIFADGTGFEGGDNESWGIDNLEVILNGVPVFTTILSNDTLLGGAGNDTLNGADGNDLLNGQGENDLLLGNDGNDSLLGGAGQDSLIGGNGDDTAKGQSGNDTLLGSDGFDSLDGGLGNDVVASGGSAVPILIAINNVTAVEGSSGTTSAVFNVTLSSASTGTVSVDFTTVDGTASAPSDFTLTSGTLTFAAGATTQTITVPIVADTTDETNEAFTVVLSNPVDATINDAIGLASIVDDDSPSSFVAPAAAIASAFDYLQQQADTLGLSADDLKDYVVTDQYTTAHNGVTHLYLRQTYQGLPIIDADINVNILPDGTVLSANSAFVANVSALNLSAIPSITVDQAFDGLGLELAEELSHSHSHGGNFAGGEPNANPPSRDQVGMGTPAEEPAIEPLELQRTEFADRLQWVKTDDGGLELVWTINVMTANEPGWYDSSVSATTGQLLHNSSWISHASYNVIDATEESPLYTPRTIEVDPQDATASPFGWHDTDGAAGAEFTDTRGNNVFAQSARDDDPIFDLLFAGNPFGSGPRPDGGAGLVFDFPFDDTQDPAAYLAAATANLFYDNNVIHDIHYQYGFDEVSGNFQVNNYGNGGLGNDQVGANAQAGANLGYANNAFMATPPDGFSPLMAMFVFNINFATGQPFSPPFDSDFENGIITHEFGHGVSNRLTGGPANSNALNALQSGGMGEGWSDWWALMFTQHAGDQDVDPRPIGNYVLNQTATGPGIRRFPYSFDLAINPLTLNSFNGGFPNNEVHNAGEIWSSALWDMNWLLINGINTPDCQGNITPGYGFDPDLYNGTGGNNIALQLVMDGLKLQPANPTFTQARDAILQADVANNGGANQRAIWTAFARRGFGFSADSGPNADSQVVVAAFDLPPELGSIGFDMLTYDANDRVDLMVCDPDRAATTAFITVTVTTSTGDSEDVVLNRQPDQTFVGGLFLQSGPSVVNNGFLDIPNESALLSVTYTDTNDGTGASVTLQAFAAVVAAQGDTLIGDAGNDLLIGGAGDDIISAGGDNDTVLGGDGDDSILGGSGMDRLDGQAGNDTLRGQGGKDTMIGGEGDDVFEWDATSDGDDSVTSTNGSDQMLVTTGSAADIVSVGKTGSSMTVTSGANVLVINPTIRIVSIDLGAGNDMLTIGSLLGVTPTLLTIDGNVGNDILDASAGVLGSVRLRLNGGEGNDSITGSVNDDTLDGGAGLDSLLGGAGNDTLLGGADADTLNGNKGNDSLQGDDGNDGLIGGDGNDLIRGGLGNDNVNGNSGADTIEGNEGKDTLQGSAGNDSLAGGVGRDYLTGGDGNDTLDGGRSDDTIFGDAGADTIRGDHGNDSIDGGVGADTINGGDGNDTILSGDDADLVAGGDGDDNINAGGGNDIVTGGDGKDTLLGGGGSDVVLGDDGDDFVNGQGGSDTVAGGMGVDTIIDPASEIDEQFRLSSDLLMKLGVI